MPIHEIHVSDNLFFAAFAMDLMYFIVEEVIGIHSRDVYIIYNLVWLFVALYLMIKYGIRQKYLSIIFIFGAIFVLSRMTKLTHDSANSEADLAILIFLCQCLACAILGAFFSDRRPLQVDYARFHIIISLGLIVVLIRKLSLGLFSDGVVTYQSVSYYSALMFGIGTYLIKKEKRFRNLAIEVVLTSTNAVICIAFGGRAAFILLVLYLVIAVLTRPVTKNSGRKFFVSIFVLVLFAYFTSDPSLRGVIKYGLNRATEYLGGGSGIRWDKTSNRDIIYGAYLNEISAHIILGSGILSDYYFEGDPHNLFIEVLYEGGLVYLMIWVLILLICLMNYIKHRSEYDYVMRYIIPAYVIVMSLFSGSYIRNGQFWMLFGYFIL